MQCFFNAASKRAVILLLLYVKQLKWLNIDEMRGNEILFIASVELLLHFDDLKAIFFQCCF